MRSDALGFFWRDEPVVKPEKAEKVKCTPPEPTWLDPSYLPGLEAALRFDVPLFTDRELVDAALEGTVGPQHKLVFDIECYWNYYLAAFASITTGKVVYLEMYDGEIVDIAKLQWILNNFCIVTFNGFNYDLPITALALASKSCKVLKTATNDIILRGASRSDILRPHKVKQLRLNHIDLIEVAPLDGSLKIYGGRLHAPRMQDLPFAPETLLSKEQIAIIRYYCVNDLVTTALLHNKLASQLALRETMGREYKMDLRSKSDAQVAEAVIAEEVGKLNGSRCERPKIAVGTVYRYKIPAFMQFQSPLMQWVLDVVRNARFVVSEDGTVSLPPEMLCLSDPGITIGASTYTMRIGGLHSTEKKALNYADDKYMLRDEDVESFYPRIILNQGLYPQHLGPNFLRVYKRIVDRRVDAKHRGDKVVADSLKITINGSYGKLGSPYSVLYAPDLLIQVTVTGQLSLLMLIERLEIAGFHVVSANTDGIVIRALRSRNDEMRAIIEQWERDTNYKTEETKYRAVYSRDVNNYIAVYETPKENKDGSKTYVKTKGVFADPGLQKNPTNTICVSAIIDFLVHETPIDITVRACTDIRQFVSVRRVKGGAVKDAEYLGKAIRWYYAMDRDSVIVYAESGKKVPKSDGAKPLMDLPKELPKDLDHEWYIKEAYKMLSSMGYPIS